MSGEMSGYDLLVDNFRGLIFYEGISEGNVRGEFPGGFPGWVSGSPCRIASVCVWRLWFSSHWSTLVNTQWLSHANRQVSTGYILTAQPTELNAFSKLPIVNQVKPSRYFTVLHVGLLFYCYHLRGNAFGRICLCVRLSLCLSNKALT